MKWLSSLLGERRSAADGYVLRRVTSTHPLVIQNPKIGFLNLIGVVGRPLIEEDTSALKSLFSDSLEGTSEIPVCDVLMIYSKIEASGVLQNAPCSLREIIHRSRAPITVVATENDIQSYIAAGKRPGPGKANLVMTLKRHGPIFPNFFRALFSMMHRGVTMPMAWIKLAPQIPGRDHKNVPETLCAMEVTHILFKSDVEIAR